MSIDLELVRQAGILTGIGMGTAFGLLLVLTIFTWVTGTIALKASDMKHANAVPTSAALDEQRRAKAIAAVIAVTAVLTRPAQSEDVSKNN